MKKKLKVLFAASEAVPFAKTGGLGDVAGSLPRALKDAGCDVRVILPKYQDIPDQWKSKMKHVADFNVSLSWRNLYCGIETLTHNGIVYYFVDNEYYFGRHGYYGYYDDGERIAFFSKAIVEAIAYLPKFPVDILHCNDWHTSLAPVFLREFYRDIPTYAGIKTILTIHNLKFQGQMDEFVIGDILGLQGIKAAEDQLRCGRNDVNFLQGGLSYADRISTVSPTYAGEIQQAFYGEGLEDLLRRRNRILRGILNGIDVQEYNPATDTMVAETYSSADLSGKAACKAALQRELGLPERPEVPILCMIGRLTDQKGLSLVTKILEELLQQDIQFIVLGTGDTDKEIYFHSMEAVHPEQVRACICFNEGLAHRIYAGSDLMLMPSVFEPCGLTQMIAMRYGTIPVVRETGGLKDSVIPYNQYTGEGTGFSFANINAHELLFVTKDALHVYAQQKETWRMMQQRGMEQDWSWKRAAQEYVAMYEDLVTQG